MGRRYFYAIVDETYRQQMKAEQRRTDSWQGYEGDAFWQRARLKTRRKLSGG